MTQRKHSGWNVSNRAAGVSALAVGQFEVIDVKGMAGGDDVTEDEIEDEVVLVASESKDNEPNGVLDSGLRQT